MGEEGPPCYLPEFDEEDEVCIGEQCFTRPYRLYVPPVHYKRVRSREYRWKLGAKISPANGFLVKFQRALAFPDCLGLSDDARWRWQWCPLSLVLGIKVTKEDWKKEDWRMDSPRTFAYAKIKPMSLFCGKLALRPVVELFPVPALSITRTFDAGGGEAKLCASVEVNGSLGPQWRLKLDWQAANLFRVLVQQGEDVLSIQYSKRIKITKTCQAVATGELDVPSNAFCGNFATSLPARLKIASIKLSQILSKRTKRHKVLPTSTYLKSSREIGKSDRITVVPGHWIDPGYEPGAPGEREFNLDVVNVLERQLRRYGWQVLRPDRDAPNLSWEEYLNWASRQSLKGTPVLEIHGQGSNADYRGYVLGVIGDPETPLGRELSKDFGIFDMDWSDLAVPCRGGIILESFNSDEVLEMAPWHRACAVRRLANRIITCIERASYANRGARGMIHETRADGGDLSTLEYPEI
ncbi:uncharacterized protein LOC9658903 isoform X1 [Selaginella moellendorffii]|uniref:uncharacterized protein LOC9658903 isoform X1 n=1 Tax=Selaginella moellendorffii TaxID=88036 RepID=UPI000D1CC15B|nr:uncharacterized protein LOC9658903 isoform X1 [Selaginella moellendorffii]|eukprot:XP_024529816.1 uncharacterized protein LOC9658903 isoform X1 [Selaginella moellendorffii]